MLPEDRGRGREVVPIQACSRHSWQVCVANDTTRITASEEALTGHKKFPIREAPIPVTVPKNGIR